MNELPPCFDLLSDSFLNSVLTVSQVASHVPSLYLVIRHSERKNYRRNIFGELTR
ncbi:hypothetical protein GYMLUDRAFT_563950 [Collybiopsis luxurians FD-317 M1]|uniref:Uncharacterized protein n=1 Tax=Collybiopsis luxurians FD-317 M1 TaxID=944289 RepID=A0A0D0CG35_9AGAR|nr:hypothetical protein GYMLUDRAFT_563950 [Collybiopsis luxurians FD-317 M1]